MEVDRKLVKSIAELAQIEIPEEQIQEQIDSMDNILSLVAQMESVDTEGVEPIANPLDATQRLRTDVVTETNMREEFQSIAPDTEEGLYLVPRVIS